MVHRIVGSVATRSGATPGAAVAIRVAVILASWSLWAPAAFGFCRTTTCAIKKPPVECVRDANGCWSAGIPLHWEQKCVSYAMNVAASPQLGLGYAAARAIVDKGFSLWPNATCLDGSPSIAFSPRPDLTCARTEYNPTGPNSNSILFRDDTWTHDPAAIALTTVAFSVKTGRILDADMEINSGGYRLTPLDLEFVIAHESGHFSGLDHAPDPSAVMYFQYASGNTSDTLLTPDDVDAICTAYPPSRIVPACDFEPEKGFAIDCGGDVHASCSVAAPTPSPSGGHGASIAALLAFVATLCHRGQGRGRRLQRRQASQAGSRPRNA